MKCTNPFTTPAVLRHGLYTGGLTVPCGRCMHCRIQRTAEWTMRLLHEYAMSSHGIFLTLTYDPERLPYMDYFHNDQLIQVPTLQKSHVQNFVKRLRKRTNNKKIKYFATGEYGDQTYRPHYHLILFNYLPQSYSFPLSEVWKDGFTHVGNVTPESLKYVAGYVQKKWYGDLTESPHYPSIEPFSLKSQGLGKNYVLKNKQQLLHNACTSVNGVPVGLPRYYKKLLTDDDPKKLEELNKKVKEKQTPVDIQKLLSRATPEELQDILYKNPNYPLDNELWQYVQTQLKQGRSQYNETLLARNKLYKKGSL